MNKHKWHNKLFNLAVAFALVVSMVSAVVPVVAEATGVDLSVTVTTPEDTYCCCETYNVTATIENAEGCSNATAVNATLTITGNAELTGSQDPTKTVGNVTAQNSETVEWELHCTGADEVNPTKITVTVKAGNADQVSGYTEVTQKSGDLQAFIIEPSPEDEMPVCTCFNLTFFVKNTGCNNVTSIFGLVWTVGDAEIVTVCGEDGVQQVTTGFLEPAVLELNAVTENYTLMLHCTGPDRAGIHVTPYGNDVCDEATPEIVGESAIVEWD